MDSRALGNRVTDYYVLGKLEEAQRTAEEFVNAAVLETGANSLQSAAAYNSLGLVLLETKQYVTSESCLSVATNLFERFYGANHVVTLTSKANLAEALYCKGAQDKALTAMSVVVDGFKDTDQILCAKYSLDLSHKLQKLGHTQRASELLKLVTECLTIKPNTELQRQLEQQLQIVNQ